MCVHIHTSITLNEALDYRGYPSNIPLSLKESFIFPLVVNLSPKSRLRITLVHKHHWIHFKSIKAI